MRERVVALKRGDAFERETRRLAEAVLRRDAAMGWGLLESPLRLNMRTIDSVCATDCRFAAGAVGEWRWAGSGDGGDGALPDGGEADVDAAGWRGCGVE